MKIEIIAKPKEIKAGSFAEKFRHFNVYNETKYLLIQIVCCLKVQRL